MCPSKIKNKQTKKTMFFFNLSLVLLLVQQLLYILSYCLNSKLNIFNFHRVERKRKTINKVCLVSERLKDKDKFELFSEKVN